MGTCQKRKLKWDMISRILLRKIVKYVRLLSLGSAIFFSVFFAYFDWNVQFVCSTYFSHLVHPMSLFVSPRPSCSSSTLHIFLVRPVPSVALLIPLGPTVFRFVRSFDTAHYIVNVRSASSVHGSVGTVRSVGSPALTVLHCQDISLDFFRQCSTLLRTRSGEIAPSYTSANFYFINFRRESSNCGNI